MNVEIFGTPTCAKCETAKKMCETRGIDFEYTVVGDGITKEALFEKIGKAVVTVPQIFVDGEYLGGLDSFLLYIRD